MKKPAPISMSVAKKKAPTKKVAAPTKKVAAFNMDAPEHKSRIVTKIVKDKELEARVTRLEGAEIVTPIVKVELPPRARITSVKIKYDAFGTPEELVPAYSE